MMELGNQIKQSYQQMQRLVCGVRDLLISRLACIDDEMESRHNIQLPVPTKAQAEGHAIEHAMHSEDVPAFRLALGNIRILKKKIADAVTSENLCQHHEHLS